MLFAALPALAQSGVTGMWTGTYSASITVAACSNKTFNWSGNATFALLQSGAAVTGRLDLTNFTLLSSTCTTSSAEITRDLFGTTDGSSITLAVPNDPNSWELTGNGGPNGILLQLSDPNGLTGSFTLAQQFTAVPLTNFTGTWSGTYNFTDVCPNGSSKKTYTGNFTLGLTQTAQNVGGVLTITNVPLYDQNCSNIAVLTQQMSVAGSVSGNTLTAVAFDPSGIFDFPFTATLGGSSIMGTAQGASPTTTTGTIALTQSSNQPPASDFSGHYEGTYSETDNGLAFCFNVGNVNFGDAASVNINQAGTAVSGVLVLENTLQIVSDGAGNCAVLDGGEQALPFYGTISNGTVALTFPIGGGAVQQFTFNLSGNTIAGTMQDSFGDVMQFSTMQTALPARIRHRAVRP